MASQTMPARPAPPQVKQRYFMTAVFSLAVFAGAIAAWNGGRMSVGDDGVSYLDLADAWLRHDWKTVVNGYWSPAYSWFLALGLGIFHPTPRWEPVLVRGVNFALYLFALFAFAIFWRELTRSINARAAAMGMLHQLPARAWTVMGFAMFVFSALQFISLSVATPDMCVAGVVFLLGAVLVRMRDEEPGWALIAALGVLLAFGYLAKAVMFPLSFVFLAAALISSRNKTRRAAKLAVALLIFLAISSPWFIALSRAKQRFTFGDSGRMNYILFADKGFSDVGYPFPWTGSPKEGTPRHPMRVLLDSPHVYEFSAPFRASYPPWNDPSYWYDGAKPWLNVKQQLRVLLRSASSYARALEAEGPLLVGLLFLLFVGIPWRGKAVALPIHLLLPAFAAFALYALVLVEDRYIAPFLVLVWSAAFGELFLSHLRDKARVLEGLAVAMSITLLLPTMVMLSFDMTQTASKLLKGSGFEDYDARVASTLQQIGVRPGDRIGYIQSTADGMNKYWARLAGVTIVADMPYGDVSQFWDADVATRDRVLHVFAGAGTEALVAFDVPSKARDTGWKQADGTDYYVLSLKQLASR